MLNILNRLFIQNQRIFSTQNFVRSISEYNVKSTGDHVAKKNEDNAVDEIDDGLKIEAELFENYTLQKLPPGRTKKLLEKKSMPFDSKKQIQPLTIRHQVIDDPELGLQFIRLGLKDPIISTLLTTVRSQKRRSKDRQIIIEGRRLIQEALECNLRLNTLIFSQVEQLRQIKDFVALAQKSQQSKIMKVPQHLLKTWSTLTTPPGLLAVFERPSQEDMKQKMVYKDRILPISVICDNIREPNNLGSIIRTCAALPCEQVITMRGCCDPWETKALRGGCGGHFRVPIQDKVDWEELPLMPQFLSADDCSVFVAENNIEQLKYNATVDYSDLKQIGSHNIVIIGGEASGISKEAYGFLEKAGHRGKCLHIPLADGIDSLNVSSALTLILYELKRIWQKGDGNTYKNI